MTNAPLQRENITTLIYRRLKKSLMTGGYQPGDVLRLRPLSESLGVSQTPVREALLQLVSERSLSMKRGRSITVPVLTRKRLKDLRAIRLKLEVMAARIATQHISAEDIHNLVQSHEFMMKHKTAEDKEKTLLHNFEFHARLYAACDMPDLIAIIEDLWAQTGPSLSYLYQPPFVHVEDPHPHLLIIDALKKRDEHTVVQAIIQDVDKFGAALMKRLPKHIN